MRQILVLRGGALGDFIVTLPLLVALRAHWPQARIELVGNRTAAELAVRRGVLDAAHSQAESRWAALYGADALPDSLAHWLGGFDLVLSFWPDPEGDLARHFPRHAAQRFITVPALPTTVAPAAAHFSAPLRELGLALPPRFVRIEAERIIAGMHDKAAKHGPIRRVAVHPGSGSPRKNWPAERWHDVIGKVQAPIVLLLGETELEHWDEAGLRGAGFGPRLDDGSLTLAANFPLEALVDELGRCDLFLGHDSGISHLAAACGLRCVLLFGSTDPAVWAPPAAHVHILQRGSRLTDISIEDVLAALDHATVGG